MSVPCRTPRGIYNWTPESTVTPAKPTTTPAAFTTATAANALTLAAKHEEKHEDLVPLLVPSPSNDVQTHCRMRALDWASPRCAGVRACEVCDTRGGHDARVSSESGPAAGRRPPFLSRRGRSTWPRSCCARLTQSWALRSPYSSSRAEIIQHPERSSTGIAMDNNSLFVDRGDPSAPTSGIRPRAKDALRFHCSGRRPAKASNAGH